MFPIIPPTLHANTSHAFPTSTEEWAFEGMQETILAHDSYSQSNFPRR